MSPSAWVSRRTCFTSRRIVQLDVTNWIPRNALRLPYDVWWTELVSSQQKTLSAIDRVAMANEAPWAEARLSICEKVVSFFMPVNHIIPLGVTTRNRTSVVFLFGIIKFLERGLPVNNSPAFFLTNRFKRFICARKEQHFMRGRHRTVPLIYKEPLARFFCSSSPGRNLCLR